MAKRKSKKKAVQGRSPVPPPTVAFKDKRKEAERKICRGQIKIETHRSPRPSGK